MTKHERKILPLPEGGYKGYYLYHGEVIKETKVCQTLLEAANELKIIADTTSSLEPSVPKTVIQTNYIPAKLATSPRKCCGRG